MSCIHSVPVRVNLFLNLWGYVLFKTLFVSKLDTNISQLVQNADALNQKNLPVDACLLLKMCLLLELKEIKELQKGQQSTMAATMGVSNPLSTQGSGPQRKQFTKPKLAPRKKRGHSARKLKKKNKYI